jgi:hypothetical protein
MINFFIIEFELFSFIILINLSCNIKLYTFFFRQFIGKSERPLMPAQRAQSSLWELRVPQQN